MHYHDRLLKLECRLGRVPDDEDTWLELARYADAVDLFPTFLERDLHAARLVTLWRRNPEARGVGRLLLPLLRLAPDEAPPPAEMAEAWGARARRPTRGAPYDATTGLPLTARRRVDEVRVVLVEAAAGLAYIDHQALAAPRRARLASRAGLQRPGLARYGVWVGGRPATPAEVAAGRAAGLLGDGSTDRLASPVPRPIDARWSRNPAMSRERGRRRR